MYSNYYIEEKLHELRQAHLNKRIRSGAYVKHDDECVRQPRRYSPITIWLRNKLRRYSSAQR